MVLRWGIRGRVLRAVKARGHRASWAKSVCHGPGADPPLQLPDVAAALVGLRSEPVNRRQVADNRRRLVRRRERFGWC